MRSTTKATTLAIGAIVLAGGAFAAGYITSNEKAPARATEQPFAAPRAAKGASTVSTALPAALRVANTAGLAPQSLTAAPANTVKLGSKVFTTWMNPAEFHPFGDPRTCALANDGSYIYRNLGTCTTYLARLPLPEGVALDSYKIVGVDNDAAAEMTLGMSATGYSRYFNEEMSIHGDVPGHHVIHTGVAGAAPEVRSFTGSLENITVDYVQSETYGSSTNFETLVLTVPASQNVGLFGIEIKWRKQYGPTPTTAKFTDVAPQHPYFTEVEMLAKAGVSNGCGNNRYCPDVPVTRGEMAVFLSRALGLYDGTTIYGP